MIPKLTTAERRKAQGYALERKLTGQLEEVTLELQDVFSQADSMEFRATITDIIGKVDRAEYILWR